MFGCISLVWTRAKIYKFSFLLCADPLTFNVNQCTDKSFWISTFDKPCADVYVHMNYVYSSNNICTLYIALWDHAARSPLWLFLNMITFHATYEVNWYKNVKEDIIERAYRQDIDNHIHRCCATKTHLSSAMPSMSLASSQKQR